MNRVPLLFVVPLLWISLAASIHTMLVPTLFIITPLIFYWLACTFETTNGGNVFVWIGSALFHLSFVPIVPILAVFHLPSALAVAAAYTANLFVLAGRLDNQNNNTNHSERLVSTSASTPQQQRPSPTLLVTVLYGMAVLSLGGTGSLLALNYKALGTVALCSSKSLSSSSSSFDEFNVPPKAWRTNVTRLPTNVQKWARQQLSPHQTTRTTKASHGFIHLPGSGTTIFTEWNQYMTEVDEQRFWRRKIWSVSPPPPPQDRNSGSSSTNHHHDLHPRPVAIHDFAGHDFVVTSPHQTCFVTIRSFHAGITQFQRNGNIIACYDDDDGNEKKTRRSKRLRFTKQNTRGRQYQSRKPRDLIVVTAEATSGGAGPQQQGGTMIWYLDDPPDRHGWGLSEQLVYSLDPTTMIETLQSEPVDDDADRAAADGTTGISSCPQQQREQACLRRVHALAWLLFCALPITVISIYLWYHRRVPIMGVTTFVGLTFLALLLYCLCCGVAPPWRTQSVVESWSLWWTHDPTRHFIQWWMLIFGVTWTVFSINGMLASSSPSSSVPPQRGKYNDPMWWGLHIGSLSYFVAMRAIMVEMLPDHFGADKVVGWVLSNALILVPMLILGLAAQSPLLQVLTVAGVFWMDSLPIVYAYFNPVVYLFVQAVAGLMTAVVGGWLSDRQGAIAAFFCSLLKPYAWPRQRKPTAAASPFTAGMSSHKEDNSSQEAPTVTSNVDVQCASSSDRHTLTVCKQ
jgi:hypothetical protein